MKTGTYFFIKIMALVLAGVFSFSLQISAKQELETEDYFKMTLEEMMAMKITVATKTKVPRYKVPGMVSVVTANEIRNMGARSIADILRNVPGFAVYQAPAVMNIQVGVRGIRTPNSEKILLLIDGHRVNEAYGGSMAWVFSDLMVENIKRLEIVRGPGSALYGTSAFVAVINVITKTADDIDGQQISAAGGSFSTQHYNGLFSHKIDNFQISGHLDYFDTDGASSLIEEDGWTGKPGGMAPGEALEFVEKYDFGIKMKYGDFSFRSRFVDRETGSYTGAAFSLNDESDYKHKHFLVDLIYAKSLTKDIDMTVRFYGDYFELDEFTEIRNDGFTGGDDNGALARPMVKNRTYGFEITTNYILSDHLFTGGINYEYIKQYDVRTFDNFSGAITNDLVDVTEISNFCKDADRSVIAAYFQYIWEISAYDSLTLGVRYDNYDDFGNTVNPRAGYVHEFRNNLIFKALYGSAFRAPAFSELYLQNNPVLDGNPDLDAEKISSYEAGLEYPFLKNYSVRISYFHSVIEDLITRGPIREDGKAEYINSSGETKVDGVEAEFTFEFAKDKYGFINCSYQDGEDNTGQTLFDVAHWLANFGINHGFSKYLSANVNVLWTGERTRADADFREELDSSTLVNLTLIAKNFYKGLEIRGSVYNLFDEDYRDPSITQAITNDLPTNARMFLVEARYKF